MTVNLFLYRISLARVNRVIVAAAADDEDEDEDDDDDDDEDDDDEDEDEDDDDDDDDDQGGHTSCWPGYIPRHDLQDGFRKIFLEQLRVWFANVESGIRSGLTFSTKTSLSNSPPSKCAWYVTL